MAALQELEMLTHKHFLPVITNMIYLGNPVLERIFKVAQEGSFGLALPSFDGRAIVEPLETGRVNAPAAQVGAYDTSDTWTFGNGSTIEGAEFAWKMYHSSIQLHNLDQAINMGRNRIFDMAALRMRSSVSTLKEELIKDFYGIQTDGSKKMVGFQAIAADDAAALPVVALPALATVGGIDKKLNAYWQGNAVDVSGALTPAALNAMYYATKRLGKHDKATMIVASEKIMQAYENSLTKVTDATPVISQGIDAFRSPKNIDLGYGDLSFKRIPMIADPFLDDIAGMDDKVFFINENYLNWRVLKNFTMSGWTQLRHQGTDAAVNSIFGYGALTTSSPKKQGVMINVA